MNTPLIAPARAFPLGKWGATAADLPGYDQWLATQIRTEIARQFSL